MRTVPFVDTGRGERNLLGAFGREPRVSAKTAVQTLTEIWDAVIRNA